MIKVDTHFHTNFFFPSEYLTKKRAKAIWRQWEKFGLDMVILTEHSFKNPQKSYLKLMENKPSWARTHVVPGVECVTREGIDMIVFSRDEYVYEHEKMLETYGMELEDMLAKIDADERLYAIVTHPFAPTHSAIASHEDEEYILKMIERTGILEKHNAALVPLRKLLNILRLNKVAPLLTQRVEQMENVADEFVMEETLVFGGSDAHFPRDIGPHLRIDLELENKSHDNVFDAMLSLEGRREFVHHTPDAFPLLICLIWNGLATFAESLRKRLLWFKIR